jgi:hypothetical protein
MATNLEVQKALSPTAQQVKDAQGHNSSLALSTDNVGIGTIAPEAKLVIDQSSNSHEVTHFVQGVPANFNVDVWWKGGLTADWLLSKRTAAGASGDFWFYNPTDGVVMTLNPGGNLGIGITAPAAKLVVNQSSNSHEVAHFVQGVPANFNVDVWWKGGPHPDWLLSKRTANDAGASGDFWFYSPTFGPVMILGHDGNVKVQGDIVLTHADCAEDFNVLDSELAEPGTVMVLGDGDALKPSEYAYDKRVAGVISGAGNYKPGIVLDKQANRENRSPVALLGKVFCKVDASYTPIEVGDLLTTSDTPGHAMKAADSLKAFGSVIGKALRPLAEGQGLIPILIALQ